MLFTLIAYKCDSSDYCRGCHMASYSSGFFMLLDSPKEDVIERWAQLLAEKLNTNEIPYYFLALTSVRGHIVKFGHGLDWEGNEHIEELEGTDEMIAAEKEFDEILGEVVKRKAEIVQAREEAERLAKEATQRGVKAAKELAERREFERLQKKFGE